MTKNMASDEPVVTMISLDLKLIPWCLKKPCIASISGGMPRDGA
jgi:hypothetical protein